jgi:hypothetical protein
MPTPLLSRFLVALPSGKAVFDLLEEALQLSEKTKQPVRNLSTTPSV